MKPALISKWKSLYICLHMIDPLTRTARHLFDFYLNSSIHVALAVTAFTVVTMFNLRLEVDVFLLLFIFFGTIAGYNFTKYNAVEETASEKQQRSTQGILFFSLVCLIPLFCFMFTQPLAVIIISGVMGLITISYSWPVLWRGSNLRDITGLKIFVIAFVWSVVTVVLPFVSDKTEFTANFFIEYLQRFLFVIVLTLPFDIRDIRFDTWQMATIPQMIGIKRARVLGVILLCMVLLLEFLKTPLLLDQILVLAGISTLTGFLVMQSVVKQTHYYASFWVESIPVIWWVLLVFV